MKKQTAVEWLVEQILPTISIRLSDTYIKEIKDQAKALEKEQMIQSFRKGAVVNEPEYYTWIEAAYRKQAEKYYNETFGQ
jgi:hypothetical protein